MSRNTTALACAAIALVAAMACGAAPATAAEDDAGFVDENYNGFREVIGEGDDAYWSVTIQSEGAYIATWERSVDQGLWETPDQAIERINEIQQCVIDVQLSFLTQFSTHDQFSAHPSTQKTENGDGTYSWSFAEGSAEQQSRDACSGDDPWTTEDVKSVRVEGSPVVEIQIPVSRLGPGTHKLFFVGLESGPDNRYEYPDGAWTGYTSLYDSVGEADWITVAVPESVSARFPYTSAVEEGALTDPSALARTEPPFYDESGALGAAVLPVAGAAVLLTALIGIPTVLLRRRVRDRTEVM